jgi:hypothetical protein
MSGRTSYVVVGLAALLVVALILFLALHQSGQLGLDRAGVEKRLTRVGFVIDRLGPTDPVEPSSVVTTRAYYPTTSNGHLVVHTLRYQKKEITSEVRLSLRHSAPAVAKFYYAFDGKPIATLMENPTAPPGMVDYARGEFDKIVREFSK